jgi:hypothetical protein
MCIVLMTLCRFTDYGKIACYQYISFLDITVYVYIQIYIIIYEYTIIGQLYQEFMFSMCKS